MRIFSLLLGLVAFTAASAQQVQTIAREAVPLAAQVVLSETEAGANPWFRNTVKAPEPGTFNDKATQKALFDRIFMEKKAAMEDGSYFVPQRVTRATGEPPQLIQGFQAELSQGFPNDNEGASAPNGYIISTTNTSIKIFDGNGTMRLSRGLNAFSNSISTLSGFKYDPRAVYDHKHNRWIIMYLSGSRPNNSQIVVCFSQTDDPLGAWNVYALGGNLRPGGLNVWSDYPIIGISGSDLFVTTNMFDGNNDFASVGMFQMSLEDAYAGRSLTSQTYVLGGNVFTVAPVSDQSDQPHDNFWFVTKAARTGGANFIFYEVDKALKDGGTLQPGVTLSGTDVYSFAPPAPQANSAVFLSPGDSRIHTAYRRGQNLYFIFNTGFQSKASLYYAHLKISPLGPLFSRLNTQIITNDSLEYSFPSISWAGYSDGDNHASFLFFNYSGVDHLPGTGAMYMSEANEVSPPLICSRSDLPAPANQQNPEDPRRWGDYTDVSHQAAGVGWGFGYHYPSNRREATFASQIIAPLTTTRVEPGLDAPAPVKVFPSPSRGRTSFVFEVPASGMYRAEIVDVQGRVVERLVEDGLIRGEARLAFDTRHLPAGVYHVLVSGVRGELMRGKFVVSE